MSGATAFAALSGRMRLVPGARPDQPAIVSTRPDLAPRLAVGRPAGQVPGLLAALFTLCAHAHRWTARQAVEAAGGEAGAVLAVDRQTLRWVTLREQLLRIAHDWPRRLRAGLGASSGQASDFDLNACPLWRASAPEALQAPGLAGAVADWLGRCWLGRSPERWLQAYESDPDGWPQAWAASTDTAPARLLHEHGATTRRLAAPGAALDVLSTTPVALSMLARQMLAPGFCSRPSWQGECVDTGPWSRAADPLPRPADTVWTRLVLRLVEVVRLSAAGGELWLSHGALPLGPGEGLAWTEMARGLLVHRVRLADADADHRAPGESTVADWRVLAPTEWNFHPQGALAQALRRLAPDDAANAARLAVAFDPCVDFEVAAVGQDADLMSSGASSHA